MLRLLNCTDESGGTAEPLRTIRQSGSIEMERPEDRSGLMRSPSGDGTKRICPTFQMSLYSSGKRETPIVRRKMAQWDRRKEVQDVLKRRRKSGLPYPHSDWLRGESNLSAISISSFIFPSERRRKQPATPDIPLPLTGFNPFRSFRLDPSDPTAWPRSQHIPFINTTSRKDTHS
ncbi:hypothetical protein M752DRAFT_13187 [Aspergillus phoenicis ATCC 13157]|uniref:Uncharacterized protein n=1 Tax=Aspergillus phoenicis ATCC 13157 TaxID=1353007 RepID=A0A370Q295_ASPPH|nr:hypothetical protein M752DRAFT_13187 [Aspergillus phoenicis ATCC 13157]